MRLTPRPLIFAPPAPLLMKYTILLFVLKNIFPAFDYTELKIDVLPEKELNLGIR